MLAMVTLPPTLLVSDPLFMLYDEALKVPPLYTVIFPPLEDTDPVILPYTLSVQPLATVREELRVVLGPIQSVPPLKVILCVKVPL